MGVVNMLIRINVPEVWALHRATPSGVGKKYSVSLLSKTIKSSTATVDGAMTRLPGERLCKPLVTLATTFRADTTFSATSKAASIRGRPYFLTRSSCLEIANMASLTLDPKVSALFSAITTATDSVARVGSSLLIRFHTSGPFLEPL